ncbi:uncharacterized protein MUC8 [Zalophus californianus]|uniref:Uncharacterized protein MUC8 n=1 Tax=Zalophus californianus TaxID=9704 RepID=A0A6P9F9P1_ZALCA|nr:uncharacterized protein MUC8 [Zalophus californianus]
MHPHYVSFTLGRCPRRARRWPREEGFPVLGCAEGGRVPGRSAVQRGVGTLRRHRPDGSVSTPGSPLAQGRRLSCPRMRGGWPGARKKCCPARRGHSADASPRRVGVHAGLAVGPGKKAFLSSDARRVAGCPEEVLSSAAWALCGCIAQTGRCPRRARRWPREEGFPVLGCAEGGRVPGRSVVQRGVGTLRMHRPDGSVSTPGSPLAQGRRLSCPRMRGGWPGARKKCCPARRGHSADASPRRVGVHAGLAVGPGKKAFLSSDARRVAGCPEEVLSSAAWALCGCIAQTGRCPRRARRWPREEGFPVLGCAEGGRVPGRSVVQRGVGTLRMHRPDGSVSTPGSPLAQGRRLSCPRMRGGWPGARKKCCPARRGHPADASPRRVGVHAGLAVGPGKKAFLSSDARRVAGCPEEVLSSAAWALCGCIAQTGRCPRRARRWPREEGFPVLGCAEGGRVPGRSVVQRGVGTLRMHRPDGTSSTSTPSTGSASTSSSSSSSNSSTQGPLHRRAPRSAPGPRGVSPP